MSVCRQPRNQHKLYPVQTILLTQGRQGTPRSPSPCGSRQRDQRSALANSWENTRGDSHHPLAGHRVHQQ